MRVVKVGASRSRKVNLGNYESAEVSAWAEADLAPGDNETAALIEVQGLVDAHVDSQVQAHAKGVGGGVVSPEKGASPLVGASLPTPPAPAPSPTPPAAPTPPPAVPAANPAASGKAWKRVILTNVPPRHHEYLLGLGWWRLKGQDRFGRDMPEDEASRVKGWAGRNGVKVERFLEIKEGGESFA